MVSIKPGTRESPRLFSPRRTFGGSRKFARESEVPDPKFGERFRTQGGIRMLQKLPHLGCYQLQLTVVKTKKAETKKLTSNLVNYDKHIYLLRSLNGTDNNA